MGKAIGIHFGNSYTAVAFKDVAVKVIGTGPNNEDRCRSCIAMDNKGGFIVGNHAYNAWKRYAPNIVVSIQSLLGATINDATILKMKNDYHSYPFGIRKLSSGTEDEVAILLHGKEYTPEQLCAEIFRSLKNDAERKLGAVEYAVITVPANFNIRQTDAIRRAAKLAGFKAVRLIIEPIAVALSYGFDNLKEDDDKTLLIYDFGGGTFNLSILTTTGGQFVEIGAGGDKWLGGDEIDVILSDYVKEQIESRRSINLQDLLSEKTDKEVKEFTAGLKADVENAKKALSQSTYATIFISDYLEDADNEPFDDVIVNRETFESLIRPLIQRTIDLIEDLLNKTSISADDISNILLVGGSSCIPLVKRMIAEKYGEEKTLLSDSPQLNTACGAAILAASDWRVEEKATSENTESIQSNHNYDSVYTARHNYLIQDQKEGKKELELIIADQTPLPYSINRQFSTTVNGQKIVDFRLFADAEDGTYEKLATCFFIIRENLPSGSKLNFTFNLDVDETLRVNVKVVSSGRTSQAILARGNKDSSCLFEISNSIEEVINNPQISDNSKQEFFRIIQVVIDTIEDNSLKSDDERWLCIEQQVKKARLSAFDTISDDWEWMNKF